jgi:hypothetical protein
VLQDNVHRVQARLIQSGLVVFRACAGHAVSDLTATRWEGGNFRFCIPVSEIVAEGLGCNAGEDEVALMIAVVVFSFGRVVPNLSAVVHLLEILTSSIGAKSRSHIK